MPVEIRELVIQARLQESEGAGADSALNNSVISRKEATQPEASASTEPDAEWVDIMVEKCMLRLREWLAEKSMR